MSDLFGHISCPDCDLEICIHEEGWHLHDEQEENEDFDAMDAIVKAHHATHQ